MRRMNDTDNCGRTFKCTPVPKERIPAVRHYESSGIISSGKCLLSAVDNAIIYTIVEMAKNEMV